MNCNKCGHSINIDDVYCRFCGNKIGKITKCVVCNSYIFSDAQTCSICGSKQSEYTRCETCNEINKSNNKYCIGCGNLLTHKSHTTIRKEEPEPTKKVFKKIEPTSSNAQYQAPSNTINDSGNNGSKTPIIIAICAAVVALVAVGIVTFLLLSKRDVSNDQYLDTTLEEVQQFFEEIPEENIPEIIETTYSYYNIQFIDTVKVREQPSTDSAQVGKISKGSSKTAFSSTNNEGYQWYQIGYNEWVANDGTFLIASDFTSNTEYILEYHDTVKVNVTKDTGVYDGPGYDYNCTGWMVSTSKFQISESISDGNGEYWLKLSPCEYVPYSNVEYIYD